MNQNLRLIRHALLAGVVFALVNLPALADSTPKLPVIRNLSATPNSVEAGSPARLSWSASEATEVVITADHGASPGKISRDKVSVRPTVTTTYTVTARNAAGISVQSVTVTVADSGARLPPTIFNAASAPGLSHVRK